MFCVIHHKKETDVFKHSVTNGHPQNSVKTGKGSFSVVLLNCLALSISTFIQPPTLHTFLTLSPQILLFNIRSELPKLEKLLKQRIRFTR